MTAIGLGILIAALTAQVASADYHGTADADARVAVQDFAFAPAIITITAGSAVSWEVRKDPEQHTVTPVQAGSFTASGQLFAGDDFTVRFTDPGRYDYVCSLHPFMTGTVVVEAVAAATLTAAPRASMASVASVAPSPTLAEPVDGASDNSTAAATILVVILIVGGASIGALLWRRSSRQGDAGRPPD